MVIGFDWVGNNQCLRCSDEGDPPPPKAMHVFFYASRNLKNKLMPGVNKLFVSDECFSANNWLCLKTRSAPLGIEFGYWKLETGSRKLGIYALGAIIQYPGDERRGCPIITGNLVEQAHAKNIQACCRFWFDGTCYAGLLRENGVQILFFGKLANRFRCSALAYGPGPSCWLSLAANVLFTKRENAPGAIHRRKHW